MEAAEAKFLADRTTGQKAGFDNLMNNPPIRLLISMIPAGERPEIVETLLKEAFNAGWSSAELNLMMASLKAGLPS